MIEPVYASGCIPRGSAVGTLHGDHFPGGIEGHARPYLDVLRGEARGRRGVDVLLEILLQELEHEEELAILADDVQQPGCGIAKQESATTLEFGSLRLCRAREQEQGKHILDDIGVAELEQSGHFTDGRGRNTLVVAFKADLLQRHKIACQGQETACPEGGKGMRAGGRTALARHIGFRGLHGPHGATSDQRLFVKISLGFHATGVMGWTS